MKNNELETLTVELRDSDESHRKKAIRRDFSLKKRAKGRRKNTNILSFFFFTLTFMFDDLAFGESS